MGHNLCPQGLKASGPVDLVWRGPKTSLIMGCVEGQSQAKESQTKKGPGFSEKNPRPPIGRELLHANVSPSMLISRSLAL